jgi:hypothetical protein
MQAKNLLSSVTLIASVLTLLSPAKAEELSGDTRLACEAVLCLATGTRPGECTPSLQRYFSISYRYLSDTIRGRLNFLNMCPVPSQSSDMQSLISAMANGAGRCDAQSLNSTLGSWSSLGIGNRMPSYCTAYTKHAYTDFSNTLPRFVGLPERGGNWVETRDYDRALAAYNARVAAEDAAAREAADRANYTN